METFSVLLTICAVTGEFPAQRPESLDPISEGRHYCGDSLRILDLGLKFGEVMHCTMQQITLKYGHAWPIFALSHISRPRVLSFSERLLGHYDHYSVDDTFVNAKFCISIQISQKFVHIGPIGNMSTLVPVMAFRRTGDKVDLNPLQRTGKSENIPMAYGFNNLFTAHSKIVSTEHLVKPITLEQYHTRLLTKSC